jgi:flagellar basal body rod protein FlgG
LDDARRLSQLIAGESYLLDPPVVVPDTVSSLKISADGTITAPGSEQEQSAVVGRISCVRFDAPRRLFPQGYSLFFAPDGLEPRNAGEEHQSAVRLRQFAIEQSNVKRSEEEHERKEWEAILQSLPSTEIPHMAQDNRPPIR